MSKTFFLGLRSIFPDAPFTGTRELFLRTGHNTGNLAFGYALQGQVEGTGAIVPWEATKSEIDAAGDLGVMPCANQLGRHADMAWAAERLKGVKSRLVAVGMGGQFPFDSSDPGVPQGTLDWLAEIVERAPSPGQPNISVRGDRSMSALERYGLDKHAVLLGCPSLFLSPDPELGATIARKFAQPIRRVGVTAGHQDWSHLKMIEASLCRVVGRTRGSYIAQSALQMVALCRGDAGLVSREELAACRDYMLPDFELDDFIAWARAFGNVFFDVPAWIEHLRHCDFVAGTRIHGVMLALQAGTPALCITHDSRTLEFCQAMRVPYVESHRISGGFEFGDLKDLFVFDHEEFDANRRRLGRSYVQFLTRNGLQVSGALRRFG